jgi:integrase
MKLTQKTVAALALPKGTAEKIWWDDDTGHGFRVREGGSRTWLAQYKLGTKQRRMTIGKFPAMTAEQARETAGKLYAMVRLGRDPAGEKTEGRTRAAETMGAVLPAYLTYKAGSTKPRSYEEIERHLLKHGKPLHGLQLAKIDRRSVATRLTAIAERSGPTAANRVRASLSGFFVWCIKQGLLDNNPVFGTGTATEAGARDRVLKDDELREIWQALPDDQYGAIVKLLTLTAQRREEIAGLARSEIDFEKKTITLPATRTKNSREHVVPLSAPALAILKAQPLRTNADGTPRNLLFGFRDGPFSGWSDCKEKLDAKISDVRDKPMLRWTLHDLRRTAATRMADLGVQPHVIEAALNHASGHKAGVGGVYNRSVYSREAAMAFNLWAEHVAAVVESRGSKVVPLRAS